MAITFHQKGPEEKGITPYELVLDKDYTVQEFMDEILKDRVYDKGLFRLTDAPGCIEYAYGHLRYGWRVTEPNASRKVKSVKAEVRWSQIDYYIETGDADERES